MIYYQKLNCIYRQSETSFGGIFNIDNGERGCFIKLNQKQARLIESLIKNKTLKNKTLIENIEPSYGTFKGKDTRDMTRIELLEALQEMNNLYTRELNNTN